METMRISLLSNDIQEAIVRDLKQLRLCDLDSIVNTDKYLQMIELERFYKSAQKVLLLDLNLDSEFYPFEESFDEVVLKIKHWIQDVIENN